MHAHQLILAIGMCAGAQRVFSSAKASHVIENLLQHSVLHDMCPDDAGDMLTVRLNLHRTAVHVRKPLPGLLLAAEPALTLISVEPRIVLLQNALTPAECQVWDRATVELAARETLSYSHVVGSQTR